MSIPFLPHEIKFHMETARELIFAFSRATELEDKNELYDEIVDTLAPLVQQDEPNPRAALWLANLSQRMAVHVIDAKGYNAEAENFLVQARWFYEIACILPEDEYDSVALANNALAMHYLTNPYLKISPYEKYGRAFELLNDAAEAGLPSAQINLAVMHHMGRGTVQSDSEALKWIEKAWAQRDRMLDVDLDRVQEFRSRIESNLMVAAFFVRPEGGWASPAIKAARRGDEPPFK